LVLPGEEGCQASAPSLRIFKKVLKSKEEGNYQISVMKTEVF
jgi:hypothetical protein